MSKYTNTKDLKNEFSHYVHCEKESEGLSLAEINEVIDRLPSADVVEVVRCKDCEHGDVGVADVWCYLHASLRCKDGFCDNGEPKSTITTEDETEGGGTE